MKRHFQSMSTKIIFALFLLFLILQHQYIYLYFDDYGHASLSYGKVIPNVNGTNFNFEQFIAWISWYYMEWGGRVVYYFLFLIPLLSKSISLFMFIQSIILFFIFFYMYKIIQIFSEKFCPLITIISLITLFGLISIDLLKESVYWASASVCYIWSLLPLLMGIYYFINASRNKESNINKWESILISGLFFFAASSFEQSGAAALVFVISYTLFSLIKGKKVSLKLVIPSFFFSLLGVSIQYLSPGNYQRMKLMHADFLELSFLDKLRSGVPSIVNYIFDPRISIFIVILSILSIASIVFYCKHSGKRFCYLLCAMPILYLINIYFGFEMDISFKYLLFAILSISLLLFLSEIDEVVPLFITIYSSIFCLVLSPVLQLRSLVFFLILLFIPIVIVLNNIFMLISNKNRVLFLIVMIAFMTISFNNYKNNFIGYKVNYEYAMENHRLLTSANRTGNIDKIQLYRYPMDLYREPMPYDESTAYSKYWLTQYYDLPETIEIEWVQPSIE
ncbi:DUF6056 family protein [Bacillus sp. T3]|uniref:DUF6056 family protein n=1 Tax=Bacillus sp. T3 TaxID=467262 RepID=UPI00298278C0|nr:DUF6056 family protein [Bacillus sp. T3]